MRLDGIHHITAITGDAPGNVEFYVGLLGLRLVKRTVNQDDPTVYHLFYADEDGSPGSDLTFFEYPGAARGRAGDGMVHRVCWRVASPQALEFWERRLTACGVESEWLDGETGSAPAGVRGTAGDAARGVEAASSPRADDARSLLFRDPEGLAHELLVADVPDAALTGGAPDIPAELALLGFDAVRAYSSRPTASEQTLRETLGFQPIGEGSWEVRGPRRGGRYLYDDPPAARPRPGSGTVHHVAFASEPSEQEQWQQHLTSSGLRATPVIDRFYFRSIYFREPSGVLMEIATIGPGFAVDEDPEHLGGRLSLPPRFESLRERLNGVLTPLPDPRARAARED
ncbi:MAG: VOC family protein [Solirubrobacteraceae bacterium]